MDFLFQCTERWRGQINGHSAQIYTQKISEFITNEQKEIQSEFERNAFDLLSDGITTDWMQMSTLQPPSNCSLNISNKNMYDCFLHGYIDVRITQNLWEIRRRKADALPFPVSMLETQYTKILTSAMEYFDFVNHFQWFDVDGKDIITEHIDQLQHKKCISITSDGQKRMIHQISP